MDAKWIIGGAVAFILFIVALYGTLGYVIGHFVVKFW